MNQLTFFENKALSIPDELASYHNAFFSTAESMGYLDRLTTVTPWNQETIHMYGKMLKTPRLTAWYGDEESIYQFSGNKYHPLKWTPDLLSLKEKVEQKAGEKFNSVLLNFYRDGNDSVSWHSDDEPELGTNPVIASVSFGQPRRFDIRNKSDHQHKFSIELENGSLLVMKGDMQKNWEHRVPKSIRPMKHRINLTFRMINT
ncbi:alpha-ketoglutarate-dependent dioxygenase AlkB [Pedobacter sp. HMF7647]|uniref:Alpha-ketoglutarate-dependent dioxygenase AlkB n=1 Tax=Hufsiella arboris TaxID=2695275 RepID=A0A7K1Y6I5_9SPHI|nr:alpha-ketoglutarate-dependent dioxygenase AlkB [Hufsiella arboris]MXV50173.1 alpha-ketoglutarate-dependent dioxygenase AlkB [Hufsiella arboris]